MPDELIAIKGLNNGLLISLSPTENWQSVTDQLAARIDERAEFYSGADITVELGERPVPKYELSSLKALLERRGLSLSLVRSKSDTTRASAESLKVPTENKVAAALPKAAALETAPVNPEETGTQGVLFRRTLRSGRTIHSDGHVIVFGDVNPGAKVIALGDIVVWGKLRGFAHAGASGDESAIICALEMSPSQLRIADFFAASPAGKRGGLKPAIARVRGNKITVEARD